MRHYNTQIYDYIDNSNEMMYGDETPTTGQPAQNQQNMAQNTMGSDNQSSAGG